MPLNIKNERVFGRAAQLAEETGESVTQRKGVAKKLMEIGREFAADSSPEWLGRNFDAELYGESGLPHRSSRFGM